MARNCCRIKQIILAVFTLFVLSFLFWYDELKICEDKIQLNMENSIVLSSQKESFNTGIRFWVGRHELGFMYEVVY